MQARRYLRYLQLTHPFEESIINCFEPATVRKLLTDEDNPVVYLYSDAMGVLRFRNMIYGAGEDEAAIFGETEGCSEIVAIDLDDSLFTDMGVTDDEGDGEETEKEEEEGGEETGSEEEPLNPADDILS